MEFEYKVIVINLKGFFSSKIDIAETEEMLDEYGEEGWELVSAIPNCGYKGETDSYTLFFKRQKQSK